MVSIDTLGDDAITFFRDVLRNNLTDKKSPARSGSDWIFKSRPATLEINLPYVIVTKDSEYSDKLTIDGSKLTAPFFRLDIRVWAHHINHRDEIADEAVKILRTDTSADVNGTTIKQNHFIFKRYEKYEEDGFVDGFPEVMRIQRVMVDFKYIGG